MSQIDPHTRLGWDGEEIPLELQALTLMKYYQRAVNLVAGNVARLQRNVEAHLAYAEDGETLAGKLGEDPFYMNVLGKLADSHDEFKDSGFRKNAAQLFYEAGDELEDMVTWMAIGLWVMDGATFPDQILVAHNMQPLSSDEEE